MVLIDDFASHLYQNTELPSFLWRSGSYSVLLGVHTICWTALHAFNRLEVHGLPNFLDLLKSRTDYRTRTKGLITVSNHISVLDDPVIWGALPLSFAVYHAHQNHRWSFASHDLCFQRTALSHFFTLGQCLPTHRLKHSVHGGLSQPTFTEAVRMLSRIDGTSYSWSPHCATIPGYRPMPSPFSPKTTQTDTSPPPPPSWPRNIIDPLSSIHPAPAYFSSPHDTRAYNAPSRYASNSHSWIHIFPEGFVHQTDPAERYMRYFKWGVSRLILEPPDPPDLVPIFIEGTDQIMHESRTFPRFVPRIGKEVHVSFGHVVDVESVFGDLRRRWRERCDMENARVLDDATFVDASVAVYGSALKTEERQAMRQLALDHIYSTRLGVVSEVLQNDTEIVEIRKECTRRVRNEVLKVRRARGYPDEDPKAGVAETWKLEGPEREGKMEDQSWVKET